MKITAIMTAKKIPTEGVERAWFFQALNSALECMDEVLLQINEIDSVKDIRQNGFTVIDCEEPLTANEGFNFIARHASNEWISPIGIDDYFNPENVHIFKNNVPVAEDIDIVYFPYYVVKPEERNKIGVHFPPGLVNATTLGKYNFISPASFVRKSLWDRLGGYRELPYADYDFWARALKAGAKFGLFLLPLYYQRFYSYSNYQKNKTDESSMMKAITEILKK